MKYICESHYDVFDYHAGLETKPCFDPLIYFHAKSSIRDKDLSLKIIITWDPGI